MIKISEISEPNSTTLLGPSNQKSKLTSGGRCAAHPPTFPPAHAGSYRLISAIFLIAEPFGGKWVGRCRIFFLKTLWEPDIGWIYGLCCRTCAGNVHLSRISVSHSCHIWHDLALLQNGNEPPEHKNYFLSIGTARYNVYTPRQGPLRVLATGKPY